MGFGPKVFFAQHFMTENIMELNDDIVGVIGEEAAKIEVSDLHEVWSCYKGGTVLYSTGNVILKFAHDFSVLDY